MNWQSAVQRTVTGLGYDLVDAEKSVGGLLRVFIDHLPVSAEGAQGPVFITVDDCERVTRQLQHVLEVEGCAYERLEVSSPGLDRPLNKPADYARFVGEQVEVTLKLPFKGRKKYRGELCAVPASAAPASAWRLVLTSGDGEVVGSRPRAAGVKRSAALDGAGSDQALDFSLDEVREARLVPVVDFKGRRFAAPEAATGIITRPDDEADGGRIQ
jgi:ribosome maturation factor RimP